MFTNAIFAVSGALLTAVAAVPMAEPHRHLHHQHQQRDYIWVTHIEEVIETVPVTKTVWVEPGEAVPTTYSSSSEDVKVAAYTYTPAAKSSVPAAYVAPEPISTHVAPAYVAPTIRVYVAPTTSVYVAPTPTSTHAAPYVAPTTSTPAAPAATTAASGSSDSSSSSSGVTGIAASGKSYTGDFTYYAVGVGSCGFTSTEGEAVVAVSHEIMSVYNGANPNNNPLCGKYVTITAKNGDKVKAKVVDTCPGCKMDSLDMPEALFNKVTSHGDGRVSGMEWCFD